MRTKKELKKRMRQYAGARGIYADYGYIVWQVSTGENIEILFIEVKERRRGYGTKLMKKFVQRIKPYTSVFVFRLARNEEAGEFYRSMGFTETKITGLYMEDAVLAVVNYETLCQNLSTK